MMKESQNSRFREISAHFFFYLFIYLFIYLFMRSLVSQAVKLIQESKKLVTGLSIINFKLLMLN